MILKVSRSAIEDYWQCPRLRYLKYHHGGRGVVPVIESRDTLLGSAVHELLGASLQGVGVGPTQVEHAVRHLDPPEKFTAEVLWRSWITQRLAWVFENYEVVNVEEEIETQLDSNLVLMSRLDGVLRRRQNGEYVVLEFKTAKTVNQGYLTSWDYDSQTTSHFFVVDCTYGRCDEVRIEILHKTAPAAMRGYYNEDTHDYTWDYAIGRRRGWVKFEPSDFNWPGKPENMSPAQFWTNHVLDAAARQSMLWLRSQYRTAQQVQEWRELVTVQETLNHVRLSSEDPLRSFPAQKGRTSCWKYNRPCDMAPICHGEAAPESELFRPRVSHHAGEHL